MGSVGIRPVRRSEITTSFLTGADRWTLEGVKSAAAKVCKRPARKPGAGHKVPLPRSNPFYAVAIKGNGLTWEERGQNKIAQIWTAGPYVNSYWMLIYSPVAYFPGEMRLARGDSKTGSLGIDSHVYNSRGDRAHRCDGSACFGGQVTSGGDFGCPGCRTDDILDAARELEGRKVRVTCKGDPAFGNVLRWGVLTRFGPGGLVLGDVRDCAGLTTPSDSFALENVIELQAA